MKKISYILMIVYCFDVNAQSNFHNTGKYWHYRQRLKDHFIEIDPNDAIGSNIPVSGISQDGNTVDWGDGNDALPSYIALLATEYRLLKDNGIDYTSTRDELFYALQAFNRLDWFAETYFTFPFTNVKGNALLNGFFIRKENVGIKGKGFDYPCNFQDYVAEESKDNVWNYLPGLALVKALVDDNTIYYSQYEGRSTTLSEMAKNITKRIISFMQNDGKWVIINPVTFKVVQACNQDNSSAGEIDEIPDIINSLYGVCGFQYGFAEAGNWITGGNLHYAGSENYKDCFNTAALAYRPYGDYGNFCSLYSVMGGHSFYLILAKVYSTLYYYPHFILIDYILHGNNIKNEHPEFVKEYQDLLNSAPDCGPRNFFTPEDNYNWNFDWSSPNSFIFPEKKGNPDGDPALFFNGIDYMLLYNLFWLVYGDCIYWGSSYSTTYSEVYATQHRFDIISLSTPTTSDQNITANKAIFLTPGFSTKTGSNFSANVTGSGITDTKINYSKEDDYFTTSPVPVCPSQSLRIGRSVNKEVKTNNSDYLINDSTGDSNQLSTNGVDINEIQTVFVLPNPTMGKVYINFEKNLNFHLQLSDVLGRTLYSKEYRNENLTTLDLTDYKQGIFLLKISWNNSFKTIKLVKQ